MASLTGRTIASSYTELLKTKGSTGVGTAMDTVQDGDATDSALQISTAGVKSSGTLESTGDTTVGGSLVLGSTTVTATGAELNHSAGVTSGIQAQLNAKASSTHNHDSDYAASSHTHTLANVTDSGTAAGLNVAASGDAAAGEVVKGDDSRLTDSRTPTSHTHTKSDITNLGTIPADLTDLGDTPSSLGSAGQVLKVNSAGTAVEWGNDNTGSGGSGASNFTGLNDTPSSLTADKWLKVNSGGTALEYTDAPSGSGGSGEANQNAFSNVAVSGQTTVAADSTTDTLNIAAGSNVTITTNDSTDTVTIAATDTDTTYGVVSTSADGLAPTLPAAHGGKFLKADGTWAVPPDTDTDTTYSVVTGSADGLAPQLPASHGGKFLKADGTWAVPPDTDTDTTYSVVTASADGLAPTLPASHGGKFLKADGTWEVPPDTDTDTTYTAGTGLSLAGTIFSADVGTGASQVSAGNHNHSGVYEPADATILKDADIGGTVQAYDADTAKLDVDQAWTGSQRSPFSSTDDNGVSYNNGSFDMNSNQNFLCTPTAAVNFAFTNITNGQSGYILLVNGSAYAHTKSTTLKASSTLLTDIGAAGTFLVSYIADGTNVYLTNSQALS